MRCCSTSLGFANSGVNLLAPNRDNFIRAINDLQPTTALLAKYNPEYTCLLLGAKTLLDTGYYGITGGDNGKSLIVDAALLFGKDQYRYPDNLPIVGAKGGPGGKPGCGSLPDVAKNFPVRDLVTNTGWGTGVDIAAEPGIGRPFYTDLFPVTRGTPDPRRCADRTAVLHPARFPTRARRPMAHPCTPRTAPRSTPACRRRRRPACRGNRVRHRLDRNPSWCRIRLRCSPIRRRRRCRYRRHRHRDRDDAPRQPRPRRDTVRDNLSGAVARLIVFVVVCLLGTFALLAIYAQFRFEDGKTYTAMFSNVSGLAERQLRPRRRRRGRQGHPHLGQRRQHRVGSVHRQ